MTREEIQALSTDQKRLYFTHSFRSGLTGVPSKDTDLDYIKELSPDEAKKQADFLDKTAQKLAQISH